MKKCLIVFLVSAVLMGCALPSQAPLPDQSPVASPNPAASPSPAGPQLDPYREIYSHEAYAVPYDAGALGSGYSGASGEFLGRPVSDLTVDHVDFEMWNISAFPTEITYPENLLGFISAGGPESALYIGPGTASFIESLEYSANDRVYAYGFRGVGVIDRIGMYELSESARALRDTDEDAYRAAYGDALYSQAISGYACYVIVQYRLQEGMPGSMRTALLEKIRAVNSMGTSEEGRAAAEAALKVPGVEKRTHFFTTLGSDPEFEVTTMELMSDYLEPMIVDRVLEASRYSLVQRVFTRILH